MPENAEEAASAAQDQDAKLAIVSVPSYLVPRVMEFIKTLESDESDVSGHAFSRISMGMRMGSLAAGGPTGTGCATTQTGSLGQDWTCSDNDT